MRKADENFNAIWDCSWLQLEPVPVFFVLGFCKQRGLPCDGIWIIQRADQN
jgi:hypothetical protein